MAITGIVRPKDITRDNQVSSTQVAEAKMEITGVGVVADKQKVGWLTRIIDAIWPF
jgi:flagellar L-ring protein FlgH